MYCNHCEQESTERCFGVSPLLYLLPLADKCQHKDKGEKGDDADQGAEGEW